MRDQQGMTLIELIAVIAVAALAFGAMATVFSRSVRSIQTATDITIAGGLARQRMERVLAGGFASTAASSGTCAAPHDTYRYAVTVTPVNASFGTTSPDADYKRIDVTVSSGGSVYARLTTVITNH